MYRKLKCAGVLTVTGRFGARFQRHRWTDQGICERCKITRNPLAGLKMFRPVKSA